MKKNLFLFAHQFQVALMNVVGDINRFWWPFDIHHNIDFCCQEENPSDIQGKSRRK
jgi:hypothetical protein